MINTDIEVLIELSGGLLAIGHMSSTFMVIVRAVFFCTPVCSNRPYLSLKRPEELSVLRELIDTMGLVV